MMDPVEHAAVVSLLNDPDKQKERYKKGLLDFVAYLRSDEETQALTLERIKELFSSDAPPMLDCHVETLLSTDEKVSIAAAVVNETGLNIEEALEKLKPQK